MIYIFYVLSELKVFLYLTVKFLIYCWVCFYFIVTLPLIWSVMPLIYTLLCPLYTSFVHFRPKYLFLDRFALTVDCISWTCLMPYYILQILKKSIIVLNRRLINLYNITRFCGSFLRFKEDYGTFEISVFIFIFCQQLNFNFTFYVVNLSSFSNLNSYVEVMLVFSYLQSCYLFEITWPRVCVKLTNLYLPESIHLFQVFFLWINFLF